MSALSVPGEEELPRPDVPFFEFIDLRIRSLGDSTARCDMAAGSWAVELAELGVPVAVVALADCALAYATTRVGPEGTGTVSVSLHLDHRHLPPRQEGRLSSSTHAWVLDHGFAYGLGPVLDEHGEVLADTSLRALGVAADQMAFTPRDGGGPTGGEAAPPPAGPTTATRGTGPVGTLPADGLDPLLGSELGRLCSLELVDAGEGGVELVAVPPEEFLRTAGVVHGGAMGVLAHLALAGTALAALPSAEPPRRLDLHLDYLRPAGVGRPLRLRSQIAHRSRRLAILTAELVRDDGRVALAARETCLLG